MQGGYYDSPGVMDRRQHSGQGGAFRQSGPTKVAVFTVVNSLGVIVDRQGRVVRCGGDPAQDCGTVSDLLERTLEQRVPTNRVAVPEEPRAGPTDNTTLTLVVTNQKLSFWALQRLAVQVHTSMGRAIQPFQTQQDGDVLFAVTTGEVENPELGPVNLGVLASEVAWDAVLASVPALPPVDSSAARPSAEVLASWAGRYEFGPGAELSIIREGERLFAVATGERPIYGFARGERVELVPISDTDVRSANARGDRLRFQRDRRGRVTGLDLNPGAWALSARRLP